MVKTRNMDVKVDSAELGRVDLDIATEICHQCDPTCFIAYVIPDFFLTSI